MKNCDQKDPLIWNLSPFLCVRLCGGAGVGGDLEHGVHDAKENTAASEKAPSTETREADVLASHRV